MLLLRRWLGTHHLWEHHIRSVHHRALHRRHQSGEAFRHERTEHDNTASELVNLEAKMATDSVVILIITTRRHHHDLQNQWRQKPSCIDPYDSTPAQNNRRRLHSALSMYRRPTAALLSGKPHNSRPERCRIARS